MLNAPFPPATYIRTDDALKRLADKLAGETLIGIDTESNSLYAYREQVCLIQISTREADFIVDPFSVNDMQPLGALLQDPAIEKVFHAAEYDLMCLKRDYGFTLKNLFDTMIAARICGHKAVGLGALLSLYAGVEIDKKHQRDDWGKRPLPKEGLQYAQMDTHFLPLLHDRLTDELAALGALEEARESFEEGCDVHVSEHVFDADGYWRIALPNHLTRRQAAVLRELYLLREELAQKRDFPPFKVFSDRTLVALAVKAPDHTEDLRGIEGMSPSQVSRYGKQLISAIQTGMRTNPLPDPPDRAPATDPQVVDCYTALREWRKQKAMERGVESDVIISRDALWTVAHRMPKNRADLRDVRGLGPWKMAKYGDQLLEVVRTFKAQPPKIT
jgi:ribonuclease D